MALFVRKCPCLRPQIEEDVRVLDYRHCSLNDVPGEVFNFERTLEELLVDSNQIQDLPRELFYCHGIRKLSLSDNEVKQIPAAIGSLISLEQLDLSKNGVIDIPENIKSCKYLQSVDASVNPLGKLPDGFTQLLNLTQLYLNDTFLDYLPGNFGRLSKLRILEIRENHLKTLPKSFSRLTELEKLDIGHNEFSELPDVVGSLSSLLELWCDHNQIQSITPTIGNLKQLMFFDGCKNNLQSLPPEIEGCTSLADLHLTTNQLQSLPDSIGKLGNLTTLKADDNHLTALPNSIGELTSLSELNVSANDLQELPATLGLLRYLRTLYADENELEFIPAELGSCSGITVLSLRSNKLTYIPDELGRIPRLRVLNLSANRLECLPFSIVKLKELQALWLSENQTRPLIPLQSEHDRDTGRKILTCYLLPQRPPQDSGDGGGDTDSFHASMWDEERRNRQQIHFEFGDDSDVDGKLLRQPTPYPKEMREKARHLKNLALRQQMSNGGPDPRAQGEDNPAYEERLYKPVSPSMERLTLINHDLDGVDIRMREARISNPGSPSLQDPYSLYKFDKEKFAKDKARMQQRQSSYEEEESRSLKKHGSRDNSPAGSDRSSRKGKDRRSKHLEDDGGFGEHRVSSLGSTPDIPARVEGRSPANKFTYCSPAELSQNISARSDHGRGHHHSHRSHRHRRMREYDSDTGYRSDQDVIKFRKQQQQMFQRQHGDNYSEIVPVASAVKGRRKDGYSSDLEGYSHRAVGVAYHETDRHSQEYKASVSYSKGQSPCKSQPNPGAVKNDELYDPTHYPSSSPSPFQRRKISDQSTPMTPLGRDGGGENVSRGSGKGNQPGDWKKDLFHSEDYQTPETHVDPQNRYMPNTPVQSEVVNQAGGEDVRPIPPYKPAPPYTTSSQVQRKLPPTPNRTSPYGVSLYDKQARHSPMKDYPNSQRMPDIQEFRDSKSDLTLTRSRSHPDYRGSESPHSNPRNSDCGKGNYIDMSHIPCDSPRTPASYSANVSKNSQGQGDVTSASSKDSGNYSYRERTSLGESPIQFRHSPFNGFPERRGSRNSPFDYSQDHHRNLDRYDHSFCEPPTVDIPSRYDTDIAMFKSAEPASQVSSSTDSGYGHGHNVFDKMLEPQRFSGMSQGSPSPDQFNSDSNCTTSSNHDMNGQYSRGTTPVNHSNPHSRDDSQDSIPRVDRFRVTITKNPGLGFSIAGGVGAYGNPFRAGDMGIFVTKVQPDGPAAPSLKRGDKLIEVNGLDFREIDHKKAVSVLKNTGTAVELCVERETTS